MAQHTLSTSEAYEQGVADGYLAGEAAKKRGEHRDRVAYYDACSEEIMHLVADPHCIVANDAAQAYENAFEHGWDTLG